MCASQLLESALVAPETSAQFSVTSGLDLDQLGGNFTHRLYKLVHKLDLAVEANPPWYHGDPIYKCSTCRSNCISEHHPKGSWWSTQGRKAWGTSTNFSTTCVWILAGFGKKNKNNSDCSFQTKKHAFITLTIFNLNVFCGKSGSFWCCSSNMSETTWARDGAAPASTVDPGGSQLSTWQLGSPEFPLLAPGRKHLNASNTLCEFKRSKMAIANGKIIVQIHVWVLCEPVWTVFKTPRNHQRLNQLLHILYLWNL